MRFGYRQRRRGATARRQHGTPGSSGAWKAVWRLPLRWLGVALALAAVGFGVRFANEKLREPGAFPLRQVRIEGELRNLAEADLQPVVRGYLGQNFFNADLDALRAVGLVHQLHAVDVFHGTVVYPARHHTTVADHIDADG